MMKVNLSVQPIVHSPTEVFLCGIQVAQSSSLKTFIQKTLRVVGAAAHALPDELAQSHIDRCVRAVNDFVAVESHRQQLHQLACQSNQCYFKRCWFGFFVKTLQIFMEPHSAERVGCYYACRFHYAAKKSPRALLDYVCWFRSKILVLTNRDCPEALDYYPQKRQVIDCANWDGYKV